MLSTSAERAYLPEQRARYDIDGMVAVVLALTLLGGAGLELELT